MSGNEQGPEPKSEARPTPPSDTDKDTATQRQDRERFRLAWRRRPWLACGCSETCHCDYREDPTPKRVAAYRDAVGHLEHHGLPPAALIPECRLLWRNGGADRVLAQRLTSGIAQ